MLKSDVNRREFLKIAAGPGQRWRAGSRNRCGVSENDRHSSWSGFVRG